MKLSVSTLRKIIKEEVKKIVPQQFYSGEDFDRLTTLALQIADDARANGRTEPAYGYSRGDWIEAEERLSRRVNPSEK